MKAQPTLPPRVEYRRLLTEAEVHDQHALLEAAAREPGFVFGYITKDLLGVWALVTLHSSPPSELKYNTSGNHIKLYVAT